MIAKPGTEHNLETAVLMARLSEWVYPAERESEFTWHERFNHLLKKHFGKEARHRIVADNLDHAVVIDFPDWRIIAVRGTDRIEDWIATNTNLRKYQLPQGAVHRGFLESACSLSSQLWHGTSAQQRAVKPTWFTGHSLGGAVASVLAVEGGGENIRVAGIYTFGSPRFGDSDFKAHMDAGYGDRLHRYYSHADPVPHSPTCLRGYRHCGIGYYIDRHGKIHTDSTIWQRIGNTLAVMRDDFLLGRGIRLSRYHAMGHYRRLLEENLAELRGAA